MSRFTLHYCSHISTAVMTLIKKYRTGWRFSVNWSTDHWLVPGSLIEVPGRRKLIVRRQPVKNNVKLMDNEVLRSTPVKNNLHCLAPIVDKQKLLFATTTQSQEESRKAEATPSAWTVSEIHQKLPYSRQVEKPQIPFESFAYPRWIRKEKQSIKQLS